MELFDALKLLIEDVEAKNAGDYSGNIRLEEYTQALVENAWAVAAIEKPHDGQKVLVDGRSLVMPETAIYMPNESEEYPWRAEDNGGGWSVSAIEFWMPIPSSPVSR